MKEKKPFLIMGLTSFKKQEYQEHLTNNSTFIIEDFDDNALWVDKFAERVGFIVSAKKSYSDYFSKTSNFDVIIITAKIETEFSPILDEIKWVSDTYQPDEINDLRCAFGKIELNNGDVIDVGLICLDEMGLSHSAAITARLIATFRPKVFAMLGMCAGFNDAVFDNGVTLGDVIIATETRCWDEGKYEENTSGKSFKNRAKSQSIETQWNRAIFRFIEEKGDDTKSQLHAHYIQQDTETIENALNKYNLELNPVTALHCGLLVSGPCVINSEKLLKEIRKRFSTALGLEMEGHSIYTASNYMNGAKPKTVVIKAVADFGDGTKSKIIQPIASKATYITLLNLLNFKDIMKI